MSFNTYSFEDVILTCTDESIGQEIATGKGIGNISVAMTNDRTTHEVASDGTVMISKVPGPNGEITITIQQTSALHRALIAWYNNVSIGSTDEWARMVMTIESKYLGDLTTCTGVSPKKLADRGYEAQGQMVSWSLLAAEITQK